MSLSGTIETKQQPNQQHSLGDFPAVLILCISSFLSGKENHRIDNLNRHWHSRDKHLLLKTALQLSDYSNQLRYCLLQNPTKSGLDTYFSQQLRVPNLTYDTFFNYYMDVYECNAHGRDKDVRAALPPQQSREQIRKQLSGLLETAKQARRTNLSHEHKDGIQKQKPKLAGYLFSLIATPEQKDKENKEDEQILIQNANHYGQAYDFLEQTNKATILFARMVLTQEIEVAYYSDPERARISASYTNELRGEPRSRLWELDASMAPAVVATRILPYLSLSVVRAVPSSLLRANLTVMGEISVEVFDHLFTSNEFELLKRFSNAELIELAGELIPFGNALLKALDRNPRLLSERFRKADYMAFLKHSTLVRKIRPILLRHKSILDELSDENIIMLLEMLHDLEDNLIPLLIDKATNQATALTRRMEENPDLWVRLSHRGFDVIEITIKLPIITDQLSGEQIAKLLGNNLTAVRGLLTNPTAVDALLKFDPHFLSRYKKSFREKRDNYPVAMIEEFERRFQEQQPKHDQEVKTVAPQPLPTLAAPSLPLVPPTTSTDESKSVSPSPTSSIQTPNESSAPAITAPKGKELASTSLPPHMQQLDTVQSTNLDASPRPYRDSPSHCFWKKVSSGLAISGASLVVIGTSLYETAGTMTPLLWSFLGLGGGLLFAAGLLLLASQCQHANNTSPRLC